MSDYLGRLYAFWLLFIAPLAQAAPPVFLEASVTPQESVLTAQVVYTLRFLQAIDVRAVQFTAPSARLAEVRAINNEAFISERRIDGLRYRVHERQFAIFPFASGPLVMAGAKLKARSAGGKLIELVAPELTLLVLPALPVPVGRAWLPAYQLSLQEEITPASSVRLGLGDPLIRKVELSALGVDASALPEFNLSSLGAQGFRVHALPAVLNNRFDGALNRGTRTQRFQLIPTQAGVLRWPVLRLTWWNVSAGKWQEARLPEGSIEVIGALTSSEVAPGKFSLRVEYAIWAAILILLLGLLMFVFRRPRWIVWRAYRKALASMAHDTPSVARDSLLYWARLRWPESVPLTLGALAPLCPELQNRIHALERRLYGK